MLTTALAQDVLLFALLFGLYFLALFVKSSRSRPLIFLPIGGIVVYLMLSTNNGDSSPLRGCTIASVTLPILFSASDYVLLTDVQEELRFKGQEVPPDRMAWRSRLSWAFQLFSSPRGIGWEHEPSHALRALPRTLCSSRWTFVKSHLIQLAVYAVLLDAVRVHNRWNPCYAKGGPSIATFGWVWRGFSMFSWILQTYIQIDRLYRVFGVLSVLVGLSTPEEWPPMFGSWSEPYTVQRLWGRTWHQLLRRFLTVHGQWVAEDVLALKRGTIAFYVRLVTAFLISGLIHSGIDYALYSGTVSWQWSYRWCHWCGEDGDRYADVVPGTPSGGGAMSFFMLQPVAIFMEDMVIRYANQILKANVRSHWRCWNFLGYIWVLTWFTFCMPMWLDPLIQAGMTESGPPKGPAVLSVVSRGLVSVYRRVCEMV
ncbi:hypothetical protein AX17_001729 [Amanita inopinata Kibby_2008]|nr:hypothetical protein AX17_001729 [Amanita inopinata Kibby_2008]